MVASKHGIVKGSHKLIDNHSDRHAAFMCRQQPPAKICSWFAAEKAWPFRTPQLTTGNVAMKRVVQAAKDQRECAKAQSAASV